MIITEIKSNDVESINTQSIIDAQAVIKSTFQIIDDTINRIIMKYIKDSPMKNDNNHMIDDELYIIRVNKKLMNNKKITDKLFCYFCLHYIGHHIAISDSRFYRRYNDRLIIWICSAKNDIELLILLTNKIKKLNQIYADNWHLITLIYNLAYSMSLCSDKYCSNHHPQYRDRFPKDPHYSHIAQTVLDIKIHIWKIYQTDILPKIELR